MRGKVKNKEVDQLMYRDVCVQSNSDTCLLNINGLAHRQQYVSLNIQQNA